MNRKPMPDDQFIQENRELIGRCIRVFREKKRYSQDDLAVIMKVHRSTISKVETGKFAITLDYLVKLAWYLDFDLALIDKK